jgi:hypothetical protein
MAYITLKSILFYCATLGSYSELIAQDISKPDSKNMRLVGYHDLQARTAYQPTIMQQGSRWIAYIGHHGDNKINPQSGQMEHNGTSIIDVNNS